MGCGLDAVLEAFLTVWKHLEGYANIFLVP